MVVSFQGVLFPFEFVKGLFVIVSLSARECRKLFVESMNDGLAVLEEVNADNRQLISSLNPDALPPAIDMFVDCLLLGMIQLSEQTVVERDEPFKRSKEWLRSRGRDTEWDVESDSKSDNADEVLDGGKCLHKSGKVIAWDGIARNRPKDWPQLDFQAAASGPSMKFGLSRRRIRIKDYVFALINSTVYVYAAKPSGPIVEWLTINMAVSDMEAQAIVAAATGLLGMVQVLSERPKLDRDEHCVFFKAWARKRYASFTASEAVEWAPESGADCDIPCKRYWRCEFRSQGRSCEYLRYETGYRLTADILDRLSSKHFVEHVGSNYCVATS